MSGYRRVFFLFTALLLILLALAGFVSLAYRYSAENQGGESFAAYWAGSRLLLKDGLSPYADLALLRISEQTAGWPASLSSSAARITYPLYALLVFTPFALVDEYALARAVWAGAMLSALVAFGLGLLRLSRWQMKPWFLPFYFVGLIFWFHSLYSLERGSAVILVGLLLVLALLAVRAGLDELAGALIALATILPFPVLLFVLFTLLWAGAQRRWRLVVWTLGSLVLLVVAGILFVPSWPLEYFPALFAQVRVMPSWTPATVLALRLPGIGARAGLVVSVFVGLLLVMEWLRAFRKLDFQHYLWAAALTLVWSHWSGLPNDPGNTFLLLIPAVLVFATLIERWKTYGLIAAAVFFLLLFGLPWLLFWLLGLEQAFYAWVWLLLPLFTALGLYWVRWWVVKPARTMLEELRTGIES